MGESFGMEVVQAVEDGEEGVDNFLFFKVELVSGMNAFVSLGLE